MALCNAFLTAKHDKLSAGEMTRRTFAEYRATTDRLVSTFGKNRLVSDLRPSDFNALRSEIAKTWGPVRLGNEVGRVRSVFKWAHAADVIDREMKFGPDFVKPSKDVLNKNRATKPERLFAASEIRMLLDAASPIVKATILLGVNCGFGQTDVASLPLSAVDLDGGWITFPRPKNGRPRRCPLWPETIEALQKVLEERPEPKDPADANLVFLTQRGRRWLRVGEEARTDRVGSEFGKILKAKKLVRPGRSFYSLRHSFRTHADGAMDPTATRLIMGHADGSIDAVYRKASGIADDRLRTVVEHVRSWLFPEPESVGKSADVRPVLRVVG